MQDESGPLTPAHLLARVLDQVAEINLKLGVHLENHRVINRMHRAAYAALVSIVGALAGLLASHWR